MYQITDTVKHIIIINVLMFFGTNFLLGEGGTYVENNIFDIGRSALALFYPTSTFFRPHQIITHMFMHADLGHLFFNMFAVFMFGSALEAYWGMKRFLNYYLLTGIGAMLFYLGVKAIEIYFLGASPILPLASQTGLEPDVVQGAASYINVPMLGASGAVFGLLVGYGMLFPNNVIQLLFPPVALKAKYFVMIYAGLELFLGLSGFNTGIAHFAHLGGALVGFLIIMFWRKKESRW